MERERSWVDVMVQTAVWKSGDKDMDGSGLVVGRKQEGHWGGYWRETIINKCRTGVDFCFTHSAVDNAFNKSYRKNLLYVIRAALCCLPCA